MNWVDAKKMFSTSKSTSTMVLKIYKSTTFLPQNSTFYTLFFFQIYIYNDPQNLQIYNTK